jgi:hypothetical protein
VKAAKQASHLAGFFFQTPAFGGTWSQGVISLAGFTLQKAACY